MVPVPHDQLSWETRVEGYDINSNSAGDHDSHGPKCPNNNGVAIFSMWMTFLDFLLVVQSSSLSGAPYVNETVFVDVHDLPSNPTNKITDKPRLNVFFELSNGRALI